MAVQSKHLERADGIRERHERRITAIRDRKELTDEGKRARIAKAFLDAKAEMTQLQQQAAVDTADEVAKVQRQAFGVEGLPGADPAVRTVSYRDAQDRAAGLTSSHDAAALLARAERSGDEPLARAVAGHAFDVAVSPGMSRLDAGWGDVVDAYTARRPAADTAVKRLVELNGGGLDARTMFAFVLSPPSEVQGVASLPALAAQAG